MASERPMPERGAPDPRDWPQEEPGSRPEFENAGTREIPEAVREAFARGFVEVSEEEIALLEQNAKAEAPPERLAEIEAAGGQEIPADVLEVFENPYAHVPADQEEMLLERARQFQAQ